MEQAELTAKKLPGVPFQKGIDPRRNLDGRPVGSISAITRVKQIFEENPEEFEEFIRAYIKDPNNRKHIVEMLDGKPKGDERETNVNIVIPILGGETKSVYLNDSNQEVAKIKEEN